MIKQIASEQHRASQRSVEARVGITNQTADARSAAGVIPLVDRDGSESSVADLTENRASTTTLAGNAHLDVTSLRANLPPSDTGLIPRCFMAFLSALSSRRGRARSVGMTSLGKHARRRR